MLSMEVWPVEEGIDVRLLTCHVSMATKEFVGVACKVMHYISHSSRIMNMYCKAAYEVVEVAFKVIHYISIMYKMGFSPRSVNTSH